MAINFDLEAFLASPKCSFFLADSPVKVLAEWFLSDREGQNLQLGTLDFYKRRLDFLVESLGDRKASDISTGHLRALIAHLRETRQWSVQNTNHCIQVWKSFFKYLEDEEAIEASPAHRLKKLRQEQRFPKPYSAEDTGALLNAASSRFTGMRDRTMILVLLDTGIRVAELIGLTVDDVDLAQGQLRVFGKGRKERFVPFESTVRRALMNYMAIRSVLLKKLGKQEESLWVIEAGTPMAEDAFQYQLRVLGGRAGVAGVHAHKFRHTFATEFLKNGGSPQMLQRILGHTTPMMTQRYVHITDTDAKRDHRGASPVENWLR